MAIGHGKVVLVTVALVSCRVISAGLEQEGARNFPARIAQNHLALAQGGGKIVSVKEFGADRRNDETFWALRDVSFFVVAREDLGIIGHNGAGKSTLLRLLCGIGRPTRGRIEHRVA